MKPVDGDSGCLAAGEWILVIVSCRATIQTTSIAFAGRLVQR